MQCSKIRRHAELIGNHIADLLDRLGEMIRKVLDYMVEKSLTGMNIYWQGGEAMLLPPSWYEQANDLIRREAEARGKRVSHSLQSNMLAYSSRWNKVIAEMFGNSVGTSLDYPNPVSYTHLDVYKRQRSSSTCQ